MIYFDSSALVKRYIEEKGSDKVNALLEEKSVAATSRLTYAEILAAITRRHKTGDIETPAFEKIKKAFKADWKSFTVVEMRTEVFEFVDTVIDRHALKGADSVHLSTALWLKQTMKEDVIFVASDLELLKAAKAEKLSILNPRI
ncbi:MAG: type II toxin-antitoxin system VapC family toxin [Syntrophobacteraceae bacterium]|jgi:predicted nucleic acid-binding protein